MFRLAAIVMACAIPSFAAAQGGWEVVASKEGGFGVEMPTKPSLTNSTTRKANGGTTKILTIGCETAGGAYLVQKIEFPTAIAKGAENEQLDAERDAFATEWRGKVLSEKKVRASGRLGRDFTIRGKPEKDTGILTVRVREYLDGRAVYAVLVVSQPNRELPEDSGRFLGSLVIGEAKARIAGTPEKEVAGTPLEGWFGAAIDPAGDCKFTPKGKGLTIEVPGTFHDLNPDTTTLSAPRVLAPVDGDFTLTVKVGGEFKAGGKSTNPNPRGAAYNGAGILVWSDSDNFIRLERGAFVRGGKVVNTVAFEEREGGYRGAVHNESGKAGDSYLRMERKGSRISGAVSYDGTTWSKLKPIDTVWPAKLKVGLLAINTSSEPFAPAFGDYALTAKSR
jgi:regulation of enolase protein 1 (concanavalin A-like superfamily)